MITAGTSPPISIDLGSNRPGMTLQYRERGYIVWRDYTVKGLSHLLILMGCRLVGIG